VAAPTLLLVGENDPLVIDLNQQAAKALRVDHEIQVIAGATHLFEEPGTLEEVARAASQWFIRHLNREE
jgi:alpha-beta hydrolase superfamily lysophospholipase